MSTPLHSFLKDLLGNTNAKDVIITTDNASPEIPISVLMESRQFATSQNSFSNLSFLQQHSSTSLDSMTSNGSSSRSSISRWDSMPNLGNSDSEVAKKKSEKPPSIPRRSSESDFQELQSLSLGG